MSILKKKFFNSLTTNSTTTNKYEKTESVDTGVRMQPAILQLMGSLGLNRGGLTRAVYERTSLLGKDKRVVIGALAHQFDYAEVFANILDSGALPQHSVLRDFHSDIQKNNRVGSPEKTQFSELISQDEGIESTTEVGANNVFVRFFHRGTFIGMQCQDKSGAIKYIDHHDLNRPWIVDFRDRFDAAGRVRTREYMTEDFKPRYKVFYNEGGGEYLAHWISPTGYEYRAILFTQDSAEQFKDLRAVHSRWIRKLSDELDSSVLFSDEPTTAFALSLDLPKSKKVGAIHTTHYANQVDAQGGLKGWVPHYIKALKSIDKLVFFTETQLSDFRKDSNYDGDLLTTVSHAAPALKDLPAPNLIDKDPNKIVIVSRLDKDKRIDDAIKAFKIALDKNPNICLDIFGNGPEEAELKSLVHDLGLDSNINFRGFTNDPLSAFTSATVSLMTSKYEGFGLVITESMACGTPVISYDVKYGPHELIQDGFNGCLVQNGEIDSLAQAIITCTTDPQMMVKLKSNALNTAAKYSVENWANNWTSLYGEVCL